MSVVKTSGTKSGFRLEATVAEKLHEVFDKTNPEMSSRRRADTAQVVINTLSELSPWELEQFKDVMLDYITLTEQSRIEVLSRLCGKMTTLEIG